MDERLPDSEYVPHENLICHVADRPGHDRRYAMNITKIAIGLGWKPKESLDSGLRKTVDWYLDHPAWVEDIFLRENYQTWMDKNYVNRSERI